MFANNAGNCTPLFRRFQDRATIVSTGGGAVDWQWSGGGGLQAHDWQAIEADVGGVEGAEPQSNGDHLCRQIRRTVEKLLETSNVMPTKD